jgi:hypothetical protein
MRANLDWAPKTTLSGGKAVDKAEAMLP